MPESSPTYRAEPGRGSRRCYTGGATQAHGMRRSHGGANPRPRHAPNPTAAQTQAHGMSRSL
nr:hypothetical protein [uncultured Pseudomonas sp.]